MSSHPTSFATIAAPSIEWSGSSSREAWSKVKLLREPQRS